MWGSGERRRLRHLRTNSRLRPRLEGHFDPVQKNNPAKTKTDPANQKPVSSFDQFSHCRLVTFCVLGFISGHFPLCSHAVCCAGSVVARGLHLLIGKDVWQSVSLVVLPCSPFNTFTSTKNTQAAVTGHDQVILLVSHVHTPCGSMWQRERNQRYGSVAAVNLVSRTRTTTGSSTPDAGIRQLLRFFSSKLSKKSEEDLCQH